MHTKWTRPARVYIRFLRAKFNAFYRREKELDRVKPYDDGTGLALFLFVIIWIIGLELAKP